MPAWKLLASEPIVQNRWLTLSRNSYQITDEKSVDDYYVLKRSAFVMIVATRGDEVLLVEQYRPATDRSYLHLPAGHFDPKDSHEQAAMRELFEETGYRAEQAILIGELHPLPGYINSPGYLVHCSIAPDAQSAGIQDTDEIDHMGWYAWSDILQRIVAGEINEMQAVAALLLFRQWQAATP